MVECEKILEGVLKLVDTNNILDEINEQEIQHIAVSSSKPTRDKLDICKKLREEAKKQCDQYMDDCIKENNKYIEEKKKLIFCLRRCILKLFYDGETKKVFIYDLKKELTINITDNFPEEKIEFLGIWVIQLLQEMRYYGVFDKPSLCHYKLI